MYPPFVVVIPLPLAGRKLAIGKKFPEMPMAIAYTTAMVMISVIVVVWLLPGFVKASLILGNMLDITYRVKNVMAEDSPITLVLTTNGEPAMFTRNASMMGNNTVSKMMLIV